MANVSLTAPPPAFSCSVCERPGRVDKAGPGCASCPALKGAHYYPTSDGDPACDVFFLGDHPERPPLFQIQTKRRELPPTDHFAFQDDAGRVVKNAVADLHKDRAFNHLTVRYGYAVRCAVESPGAGVIRACSGPLQDELANIAASRAAAGKQGPLVVVAHGVPALAGLGLHVKKEADATGKVFTTRAAGMDLVVVFTRTLKAIAASPGTYESTRANIAKAFALAARIDVKPMSRTDMAAGHIYPASVAEVRELVRMIDAYAGTAKDAKEWAISFDTETNTLYPTKTGLKVTAASFAWDVGLACAIPLWHDETPYDPEPAWEEVKWLLTRKPLILHNYRYDIKVVWKMGADIPNLRWDTLLAEHVLREDAKGFYGLKELTAERFPELAGYQNKVVEMVEAEEEREIAEELKERKRPKAQIPGEVMEALARLKLSPKFREATLRKKLEEWQLVAMAEAGGGNLLGAGAPVEAQIADARLVLAAKKAGEFKVAKPKPEKKEHDGAYAKVPLPELLFYAAVDADATRRLAVDQVSRMRVEDARIADERGKVDRIARFSVSSSAFHAVKRCDTDKPRYALARSRYTRRARHLAKIEYHGFRIDKVYLEQARQDIELAVVEARKKIDEMAQGELNPKSGDQLQRFFCDTGIGYVHPKPDAAAELTQQHPDLFKWDGQRLMYRVPRAENGECPIRFTATGKVQMDAAFLKRVKAGYKDPFADINLAWRKAATIRDSFLSNIAKLLDFYADGWIRPGYNLNGTATGRLSSSSGVKGIGFNNQNIPKKPIGTVNCKKLFIPDDDSFVLVNMDGAGAEVGVLTAYARAVKLIESIIAGMDTHSFFSSIILNPDSVAEGLTGSAREAALRLATIDDAHAWSYEDFVAAKKDQLQDKAYQVRLYDLRENIKRVVFGTLFGAGYRKIAEIAGIPASFAKKVIELFFARFPEVKEAIEYAKWHLRTFHFNETYFGRLRRFTIDNAPSGMLARAERQGFNFLIQSTNSDIVMDVLCDMGDEVEAAGGRLLGTVHDSIIFQWPKKYIGQLADVVQRVGSDKVKRDCPWLPVPFRWDVEVGPSYGELMKLKDYLKKPELYAPPPPALPSYEGYSDDEVIDDMRHAEEPLPAFKGKKK